MLNWQFRIYPNSGPSFIVTICAGNVGEAQNIARAQYSNCQIIPAGTA